MHYLTGLCALLCTIACNSSSKEAAKGSGGGGGTSGTGAVSAPTGAAGGECKPLDVCASFPLEKVAKLCGGAGLAKAQPNNNDTDILVDSCDYQIANRAAVVTIARICWTDKGGGAAMNAQIFQAEHDQKLRDGEVESPASGIGEKAYYRTMFGTVELRVLNGNRKLMVRSEAKDDTIKPQCLVPIANELLAL